MIDNKRLLGLITARGGSKRLKKKNILPLGGKPLIVWSIEAGLGSKFVDRLVVSTDDQEIADIARKAGADVPFNRPSELAVDQAETIDVVRHAIDMLALAGDYFQYLLLLQPTSPLRTTLHINEAIELLLDKESEGVIGVTALDHPVEWSNTLSDGLSMDQFLSDTFRASRSQCFPERYRINGAIYLGKIDKILEQNSLFLRPGSVAYKMDQSCSVDIDSKIDLLLAEALLAES